MEIQTTIKKENKVKKEKFVAVLHRSPIPKHLIYYPYTPGYVADKKSREQAKKILEEADDFIVEHNAKINNSHRYIGVMFNSKEDLMLFKLIYGGNR